ncbi:PfkB domain-containing protein [Aphelenchoides bicaudatus]|nr:PfkB domain-containing protein [Aphelenchoides bicaudatus]
MGKILVVGLCCIDIINYIERFPEEDSDTRVFEQRTSLGGNAANTSVILNQLDPNSYELFASMPDSSILLKSLTQEQKINLRQIERANAECPVSTVIVNESNNGSRTILHYRGNLPEILSSEFEKEFPSLDEYSWVHFEGRNFDETLKMVQYCIKKRNPQLTRVSVELEKIRTFNWYEQLISAVDLLFMSKDFAKHIGFNSMEEAVEGMYTKYNLNKTTIICPWAEKGVAAKESRDAPLIVQPAYCPPKVVDTLAAGDCFLAGVIYFLNLKRPLTEALEKSCLIAGRKCGQKGLQNLDLSGL